MDLQVKCPIFFPILTEVWFSRQSFIKISNTKFHENLSSGNHDDTSKQRDGCKDGSLMPLQLKKMLLWQFNVTGNTKIYVGFPVKCPNKQTKFSTDFHKSPISNFTEICPVGSMLIYAGRWTHRWMDRHDKVNRHFSRLCKCA